jgi:hypothetical protein
MIDQKMAVRFDFPASVDDLNRVRLAIDVDFSLTAERVIRTLELANEWRGAPKSIRCDNGLIASDVSSKSPSESGMRRIARKSLIHAQRGDLPR